MTLKIRAREAIQERKAGWVWVGGGWVRKEEKQEQAKEVGFTLPVVNIFGILMGIASFIAFGSSLLLVRSPKS